MMKTLVVDNDPVLLKAVSTILIKLGCTVRTAENGLNAIEVLENYVPDILFTDLIMPHVDGEKLCKIVRNDERLNSVYLVVLTAIDQENQAELASKLSVDLCIAKGTLPELRKNLKESLRLYGKKGSHLLEALKPALIGGDEPRQKIATELLHARKHLSRLIENMSEGVVELTSSGKIVSMNQSALTLFDIEEENILGQRWTKLPLGKFQKKIRKWSETCLKERKSGKYEIFESDPLFIGKKVATATFLVIQDGEQSFGIGLFHDITRQHEAENYSRKLNSALRLMKKLEAMSSMAGGVAHDFNNLLAVICGNLDLLIYSARKNGGAEGDDLVGHARKAAYAATDLMRKISCFSTFGIVSRDKVDGIAFVEQNMEDFFHNRHLAYSIKNRAGNSLISIDPAQITTVFHNILTNSEESSSDPEIEIIMENEKLDDAEIYGGQYIPPESTLLSG